MCATEQAWRLTCLTFGRFFQNISADSKWHIRTAIGNLIFYTCHAQKKNYAEGFLSALLSWTVIADGRVGSLQNPYCFYFRAVKTPQAWMTHKMPFPTKKEKTLALPTSSDVQ